MEFTQRQFQARNAIAKFCELNRSHCTDLVRSMADVFVVAVLATVEEITDRVTTRKVIESLLEKSREHNKAEAAADAQAANEDAAEEKQREADEIKAAEEKAANEDAAEEKQREADEIKAAEEKAAEVVVQRETLEVKPDTVTGHDASDENSVELVAGDDVTLTAEELPGG
jgi:hypothetical protein